MKLIIAGSRTLNPTPNEIWDIIYANRIEATEIVSGTANGVDRCGEAYARSTKQTLKKFPADWNTHGKAAGHIRNKQMAEYADALLLIWDGKSKGSANMKKEMKKLGKPVYEVIIQPKVIKPVLGYWSDSNGDL